MSCTALEQKLSGLRQDRAELNSVIGNLQGAGLQAAREQLANLDADIAAAQAAVNDCHAKEQEAAANPGPEPITGAVTSIRCQDAGKEVGDDEPYVIVASIDLLGFISAGTVAGVPIGTAVPQVHVVKVGPWAGVAAGETHYVSELPAASRRDFWDLDADPRVIAQPQDVIFLAAVVENDGSSPDAIRGAVETNLNGTKWNNLNRDYDTLVDTMSSSMAAAIDTARIAGLSPAHLNADDRIGPVRHVRLTDADLDTLQDLDPVEKSLTFTQKTANGTIRNRYTVTFTFTT